jgi:hypothetical protein
MESGRDVVKHLLRPKEFRLYCVPDWTIPSHWQFTAKPHEATCINCLNRWKQKNKIAGGTVRTWMLRGHGRKELQA